MVSIIKPGITLGGKYRLARPIGTGMMGAVWAAEELGAGREVALKLLTKPTPELRQRLLREARACARLSHPNIVRLLDVGETDEGEPFLVLELLSGESLSDMLKTKRRVEPDVAARIACDIAKALGAAHNAHIMHRDLKPANVHLHHEPGSPEGAFVVKVLDFGIAKSLVSSGEETQATMVGHVIGSPGYMSPEQVGQRTDLDHRTDIWSLGVVLYEMLAGVRPFTGPVEEVVRQILIAPIPPLTSRVRDVPQELEDIVMRCLERDRDKRISSAAALAAELSRIADSLCNARRASRASISSVEPPTSPSAPPEKIPSAPPPSNGASEEVPAWRREMQESLSAHRRTASFTNELALTPETASASAPPIVRDERVTATSTLSRRKQGRTFLYVSFGLGAAAMLSLVALLVIGLPSEGVTENAAPAPTVTPEAVPPRPAASPEKIAAPAKSLEQKRSPEPAPAASMMPHEIITATAPPTPTATPKPSSTYTPLPPCSQALRVGCRNVGKSGGSTMPNPYGTATATKGPFAPGGI